MWHAPQIGFNFYTDNVHLKQSLFLGYIIISNESTGFLLWML